eukprot:10367184-Alexandrium_andersonii.AAC.1
MATDSTREDAFSFRVPVWNGTAAGLRSFRREVAWWLEGENQEHLAKINVAARLVQRQHGVARLRGLELDPATLRGIPATVDADSNETARAQPRAGVDRALQ